MPHPDTSFEKGPRRSPEASNVDVGFCWRMISMMQGVVWVDKRRTRIINVSQQYTNFERLEVYYVDLVLLTFLCCHVSQFIDTLRSVLLRITADTRYKEENIP